MTSIRRQGGRTSAALLTLLLAAAVVLAIAPAASAHDGDVADFELLDRGADEEVTADFHGDHWHGGLPEIPMGEHISLGARITLDDGDEVDLDGDENELGVELADDAAGDVLDLDYYGDHVHLIGAATGDTEVVFQWIHDGDVAFETTPITASVHAADDEDHDDHDAPEGGVDAGLGGASDSSGGLLSATTGLVAAGLAVLILGVGLLVRSLRRRSSEA